MIAKKILLMMRRNSMTLLWTAILASWIFYVVNNPDTFTASVLSLQEKQFIIEKGRDIAYKTNSWAVDIFMSETLETPTSIDFTVSFNEDKITIHPEQLTGQGTFEIVNQNNDEITIRSSTLETIDKSQSVLILTFTGEIQDILLSEAVATYANSKQKSLSIGTLNEITSHSK